jgi:elongation factor G
MGELHLEIVQDRLLRQHKLNVRVGQPRVRYRETIFSPATASATFEREIGDRRHKATVVVQIDHLDSLDFQVESRVSRKMIPAALIEAMQEAIRVAGGSGPLEGYPLLRLKAIIAEIKDYDPGMATEVALTGAAAEAFDTAVRAGRPIILEPIMRLELIVPNENVGDVLFDLAGRRAEIQETVVLQKGQRVHAICPLAELFGYATQFRSLTRGRGELTLEPSDYRPKPPP